MKSFSAVIDSFGGSGAFALAISVPASHARTMKARNSIPPGYWPVVVDQASERGIEGITFEVLTRLAAKRNRHAKSSLFHDDDHYPKPRRRARLKRAGA